MIRVVLDTNIVVSALLQPLGLPAQVFLLALGSVIQVCVSGSVYAEYEEVLRRPRFEFSGDVVAAALAAIRDRALWVRPAGRLTICPDSDDDRFLECAQAARADYLVTGNPRHFPSSWASTRIVTARFFLEHLFDQPE